MSDDANMEDFRGDRYDQETARRFIDFLVRRTNLSASRLAVGAGVSPSTLTRIYPAPQVPNSLAGHTVRKLKATYAAYLSTGEPCRDIQARPPRARKASGSDPLPATRIAVVPMSVAKASGSELAGTSLELMTGDLGAPSGFLAPISNRNSGDQTFAIYMPSDVMQPRFRPGETLLIDRIKPMDIGDDVLVEFTSEAGADVFAIASLVARDRGSIQLSQLRYDALATIPLAIVARVYVIVGHLIR